MLTNPKKAGKEISASGSRPLLCLAVAADLMRVSDCKIIIPDEARLFTWWNQGPPDEAIPDEARLFTWWNQGPTWWPNGQSANAKHFSHQFASWLRGGMTRSRALIVAWSRWFDDDGSRSSWRYLSRCGWLEGGVGARLEFQVFLHHRWPSFRLH